MIRCWSNASGTLSPSSKALRATSRSRRRKICCWRKKCLRKNDVKHRRLVMTGRENNSQRDASPAAVHPASFRIGLGNDIHRLVTGRKLILGGVEIPFEKGLLGHSDADALSHAITDAILGAAGLGDIGTHFSDKDPRWQGADSLLFLRHAYALAQGRGYVIANIDATIIAEAPKMSPHIPAMRVRLCETLGIAETQLNLKAKTNEKLDAIGAGEAIAVQSVVLLVQ